jgi:Histidine kinase-, DNA gyrase B-, and HSP90-like ATPase
MPGRAAPLGGDLAAARGDIRRPGALERMAANLVDNALRYNTPGGDLSLTTGTAGGQATLAVANTGPVIARPALGVLFEPFQRLNGRTASDGFGLGLGDRRVDHCRTSRHRDRRAPAGRRPYGHGNHAAIDQMMLGYAGTQL